MRRSVALLALPIVAACSVSTHDGYEQIWPMIEGGRAIVDGHALASAFQLPIDCARTEFQKLRRHDDRLGCLSCLAIDVTPMADCRYKVGTIYLTIARATRESALSDSRRYIEAWRPSGSTEEIQQMPASN